MTEGELFNLLRRRYPAKEYALLARVPDGTGGAKVRTADAIAMCLWPSRGLELHGFEMKASRADWLVELKNPAKAESIARWCDRWWLVIADPAFVKEGELPVRWGMLCPKGGQLEVVTPAQKLPGGLPQEARPFIAAMLRVARDNGALQAELDAAMQMGHRAGTRAGKEEAERETKKVRDELTALQRKVAVFEEASGVHLPQYNGGRIGEAVKLVLAGGLGQVKAQFKVWQEAARKAARGLDAVLQETQELEARLQAGSKEIA